MNNLNVSVKESYDCRTLIIEDISEYTSENIDNVILEVKAPGKDCFIQFPLFKNWKPFILNCSNLELCCETRPSDFSVIPDGVYAIKYSIDPNLKTIVEFNHLRVCQLEKSFLKLICDFFTNKCSFNEKEKNSKLDELMKIYFNIKASKWLVEECLETEKGLELYNETNKSMEQYGKKCNC